jgi:hypothetical protein
LEVRVKCDDFEALHIEMHVHTSSNLNIGGHIEEMIQLAAGKGREGKGREGKGRDGMKEFPQFMGVGV